MELVEEIEEVLSARANGAMGGGLAECTGGLNGRFWKDKKDKGGLKWTKWKHVFRVKVFTSYEIACSAFREHIQPSKVVSSNQVHGYRSKWIPLASCRVVFGFSCKLISSPKQLQKYQSTTISNITKIIIYCKTYNISYRGFSWRKFGPWRRAGWRWWWSGVYWWRSGRSHWRGGTCKGETQRDYYVILQTCQCSHSFLEDIFRDDLASITDRDHAHI